MKACLRLLTLLVAVGVLQLASWCAAAHADESKFPAPEEAAEMLAKKLEPLLEQHRGDVAVMVTHLPSGASFSHQADKAMPTASLIKFPLLMATFKAIDGGDTSLEQRITLEKEDQVPGSGVLYDYFSPGLELCLQDALRLMIAYSDNTATNLVINSVGLDATNELMKQLECDATRLNSKVYRRDTSNDPERSRKYGLGSTSCADMVKLFAMLKGGKFLSAERSQQVLDILYQCRSTSGVPRYLPANVKVAHKTGSVGDTRTDAGIIDSPAGPIAFCVLTTQNEDKSWDDDNEAELLAAEVGRVAYESFVGSDEGPAVSVARVLKIGASGSLVESLQMTLNARVKPSPGLSIDGDYGPNTETAVIAFQKQEGLDPNGVVDREVWAALGPLRTEDAPAPAPQAVAVAERNTAKEPEVIDGPPFVTCKAWCFVDAKTGNVIAGDKQQGTRDPASVTKIMTAHLVLKLAEKDPTVLDQEITFSQQADDVSGSSSELKAGEQLPIRELLYGLMLPSGNDAAFALAVHFGEQITPDGEGSSYDRFIAAMNAEAEALGMEGTGYRNPHGLTAKGHVTTALDMTKLARAAMQHELFRKIVSTRQYVAKVKSVVGYEREVVWNNTNRLLGYEGYIGVKTGTTGPAGACLVACGVRDGQEVIGVILGSSSTDARYADARNLFRYVWLNQKELTGAAYNQTTTTTGATTNQGGE